MLKSLIHDGFLYDVSIYGTNDELLTYDRIEIPYQMSDEQLSDYCKQLVVQMFTSNDSCHVSPFYKVSIKIYEKLGEFISENTVKPEVYYDKQQEIKKAKSKKRS